MSQLAAVRQGESAGTTAPARVANSTVGVDNSAATPLTCSKIRRLRLRQRTASGKAIVIQLPHAFASATLVDTSETGAGLICDADIPISETIILHFADGTVRHSTVVWRSGSRYGTTFTDLQPHPQTLGVQTQPVIEPSDKPADPNVLSRAVSALSTRWLKRNASAPTTVHISREQRTLERACRENGFAWLVHPEVEAHTDLTATTQRDFQTITRVKD
jgi:hypothetical protein